MTTDVIQHSGNTNPPPVSVRLDHSQSLNLAMVENKVPLVSSIGVTNLSSEPLGNLSVLARLGGDENKHWEARIASLPPRGTYNLSPVELPLPVERLLEVNERQRANIGLWVMQDRAVLLEKSAEVTVLAYNEWNGMSGLPQLLAAFVQPNHPALAEVLKQTSLVMARETGDPSLPGYQRNEPSHVRAMVSALYTAIQEMGFSYINPPASFEKTGQKVRTPDQLLEHRMGTCLDLSVLVAGCLEQMGLNPWLIIVEGHAFPGVWLEETQAAFSLTDDAIQVLKLVELGSALVFDSTTMVARPQVPLQRAEATARTYLKEEEKFGFGLCVRAAREELIAPLPARVQAGTYEVVPGQPLARETKLAPQPPVAQAPEVPARDQPAPASQPPIPGSERLEVWKEKLLDLTLRNRLLNYRETKKSIPLECPDLAMLEDNLAVGRSVQILPPPEVLGEDDPRDRRLLDAAEGDDTLQQYLLERLKKGLLHSSLTPAELEKRQLEVAREARLSVEESGVSTLFLAIGFLSWFENESAENPRMAPLMLFPAELTRKTARDPFEMRLIDEEPRANVTLLEKLRKDYGIEIPELTDELPQDDAGVDVPGVLRLFREAVLSMPRWHVKETAYLGHFSFTKFLMWRDLQEGAEALMRSPVVAHITGTERKDDGREVDLPSGSRLEQDQPASRTFCPLNADSTQLKAIFAAEKGNSFVLEGPPGTGKSQTIANLISQCLAHGKTVLFVSEKMAALEVVHRRLEAVGLGEFCLELHSNKARKREVLEQLGQSWNAMGTQEPADWGDKAARLDYLRGHLNAYVEKLHLPRGTGESAYEVISRLIGLQDAHRLRLSFGMIQNMDAGRMAGLRELVARLSTAAGPLGDPRVHAFKASRLGSWTPDKQDQILDQLSELQQAAQGLEACAPDCAKVLQADSYPLSASMLHEHTRMAELLLSAPASPEGLLEGGNWSGTKAEVEAWVEHDQKHDELRRTLEQRYDVDAFQGLNVEALLARFTRWGSAFFLFAFFMLFFARMQLKKVLKPELKLAPNPDLTKHLQIARSLRAEATQLERVEDRARRTLGRHWTTRRGHERWSHVERMLTWVEQFRGAIRSYLARASLSDLGEGQRSRMLLLAGDESSIQVEGSPARNALEQFVAAHRRYDAALSGISESLELDEVQAWGDPEDPAHLDRVQQWAGRCLAEERALRDWCYFARVKAEARKADLAPLVDAFLEGEMSAGEMSRAFERGFGEWWINRVLAEEPALQEFHAPEHERIIRDFVAQDEAMLELSQQVVRARLSAKMPNPHGASSAKSELGLLQRELQKKTRHIPVRKLFAQIPALLRKLKPCLLMSPLSVAQYLGTDYTLFDLVVFDEASQIYTHDAIGALGRGKQAVVVGDRKQLPPTSFFARMGEEELPETKRDVVDELESILDECRGCGLPVLGLGWHYRSRHESLIAFSNYHYYSNKLNTFPSSISSRERMGVSWHAVPEGHYDKGKSRTNKAEAQAVVKEVVSRLNDPQLRQQSIGVVTFSQTQQRLIEELLDEERRKSPEIEPYFGGAVHEALFIKNLENVQGDERDVMLFSICYGPDLNGVVSMNFGPLNRTGGERRLNVAVTRARFQLIVFSTLTSEMIDLSRTRSEGARNLKTFLDYAKRGPAAIAEASVPGGAGDHDSPFEQQVAEGLAERGWTVHPQVGCSGYRIDLGVVDPKAPGRYLLGIECDGATYHSAKTARDRDRLRQLVLEGLGWKIHRIWSSDFWHNPEREFEKVEQTLALCQAEVGTEGMPGAWSGYTPETLAVLQEKEDEAKEKPKAKGRKTGPIGMPLVAGEAPGAASVAEVDPPGEIYPEVPPARYMGDIDTFNDGRHSHVIRRHVEEVVNREGPIKLDLLTRRVLEAFQMKRLTQKAQRRIVDLLRSSSVEVVGEFAWPTHLDRSTFDLIRRPGDSPEQQRKAPEIPPEEAAAAALWVLQQNIAMPAEDLAREAGRLLGFARTGPQVRSRMMEGVGLLEAAGKASRQGDRVELGN